MSNVLMVVLLNLNINQEKPQLQQQKDNFLIFWYAIFSYLHWNNTYVQWG